MNRRLIINEEEKRRILNLHESRRSKELGFLFEADNDQVDGVYNNDKDYDYKKEGDNYFFKLKETPASPKAQAYKKQGKFADWTAATGDAKDAIAKLPFLANLTAFQGPGDVDGSDEAFGEPQTAPTTSANTASVTTSAATPTASTTPAASTTPTTTSKNPDVLADLKTASQIRQEFRQGKRDKNKATRQYNQMVNKYNKLKSKMSPQDNSAYLQAINQLKQQIG
jgi:uncharacterized protein YhaN